jgi:hypothetical protein
MFPGDDQKIYAEKIFKKYDKKKRKMNVLGFMSSRTWMQAMA